MLVKSFQANEHTAPNAEKNEQFNLFGLSIDNSTMSDALTWSLSRAPCGRCQVGFFINVNSIELSRTNPQLAKDLTRADRCFADGIGVRLGAISKGVQLKANVNGTDLMPLLCQGAELSARKIFLLGAEPHIVERAVEVLHRNYPMLKIAGHHHGYFDKSEEDSDRVLDKINYSGADILLVALGSPIQERWIMENRDRLLVNTALAVGGLFDFLSGEVSRAPLVMRKNGLEWVWRLIQQPSDKWKRYLLGNVSYLTRLIFDPKA